jgi:uncharacterized protein YcaQ
MRQPLGYGRTMVHELSRQDARRIALRAQLLDVPRPTDVLELLHHLTFVQVDLTAAVAPNADLVCWSRLGSAYQPSDLDALLDARSVVELRGMLRPAEDVALFRADMADWPGREPLTDWQMDLEEWVTANEACRLDILEILRSDGPLAAQDLPDTCVVPWRSTGWTDHKNVVRMLDFMEQRGEVAVSSREGKGRLWDLAERVYPDADDVPADEARDLRTRRLLTSLGIARPNVLGLTARAARESDVGEPAVVEGVRGTWLVDPAQLARLAEPFRGRAALLSPLDRLVFDRKRLAEIFEFDYQLEMYKPAARRRWGYWALPVLHDDRLVGKLDATADHAAGKLRVHALHEDEPFSEATRVAVRGELEALARWLDLDLMPHRPLCRTQSAAAKDSNS